METRWTSFVAGRTTVEVMMGVMNKNPMDNAVVVPRWRTWMGRIRSGLNRKARSRLELCCRESWSEGKDKL